jgi:hypothetical protein
LPNSASCAPSQPVVHAASWIEDFAAGRLDPALDVEIQAHLVTCDACFAAYLALLFSRD